MKEVDSLIKTFEELGDIVAELENRVALLEYSQPNLSYIKEDIEELKKELDSLIQPAWSKKQWDKVQQLQSEVMGWRQKHSEALLAIDKLTKKANEGLKSPDPF